LKYKAEINILPEYINDETYILNRAATKLNLTLTQTTSLKIIRRSLDARKKPIYRLVIELYVDEKPKVISEKFHYVPVRSEKQVLIIGFGPAGMFAALSLIELGIKPIIIERGKDVQKRRRDIRALQQEHIVNPDSNYCFGEGGAGAYSDGKLYTRSHKRGNVKKVLEIFAQHGAKNDILIDSHPHIGSNVLPKVVSNIRQTIIDNGGEIYFNSRVTEFIIVNDEIKGTIVNSEKEILGDAVILATGHSARDIYYLLHRLNVKIEPKPFAMGVRIEHPQQLINEIQYHSKETCENLPAANYNLSCNVEGRGVYSFCMCPGGIIVPSATAPDEIVVNGMSLSRRNSPYANSGIVVSVEENDWKKYNDQYPFSGLKLQQEIEHLAFKLANSSQSAPAQRVTDFVDGKFSQQLPGTSYIPGLTSVRLDKELPSYITQRIKKALFIFNKRMKGFYTEEAQIVAAETRTSSPVRIPRDKNSLMHVDIKGLFPSGEGAGYAGGIVSSAIDGENCADAVCRYIKIM
jgi:uncharacterized FAD-dependent dehydrogenase